MASLPNGLRHPRTVIGPFSMHVRHSLERSPAALATAPPAVSRRISGCCIRLFSFEVRCLDRVSGGYAPFQLHVEFIFVKKASQIGRRAAKPAKHLYSIANLKGTALQDLLIATAATTLQYYRLSRQCGKEERPQTHSMSARREKFSPRCDLPAMRFADKSSSNSATPMSCMDLPWHRCSLPLVTTQPVPSPQAFSPLRTQNFTFHN